jgi:bifunctional DNase/RNase
VSALASGSLREMARDRPMTYQLMAELVRSLGGRIREVRLDALVDGAYGPRSTWQGRPEWS